ncbi:MAG: EAL domain-containing protein, partial [Aquificae bacterium]|nr:EAL domain-containing protein [Aquificota bacterium]
EEEAINEINVVKEVIRIAKEKKMKFALDDFGTGYSNFIYLRYFDVEILKLDGSLIKNIDKDKDNQIIIEGISLICKKKGIKLLAEMVETKEELETLRAIGIDYVQGYYFGKPSSEPVLRAKGNVLFRVKKFG